MKSWLFLGLAPWLARWASWLTLAHTPATALCPVFLRGHLLPLVSTIESCPHACRRVYQCACLRACVPPYPPSNGLRARCLLRACLPTCSPACLLPPPLMICVPGYGRGWQPWDHAIRNSEVLAVEVLRRAGSGAGTAPPWSTTSIPPRGFVPHPSAPPSESLRLEWVHGYRGQVLEDTHPQTMPLQGGRGEG